MRFLEKSLNGRQLCRLLSEVITSFSLQVVCVQRDGASVNGSAFSYLEHQLPEGCVDASCLSHGLNNVGSELNKGELKSLYSKFKLMMSKSTIAKMHWRQLSGSIVVLSGKVR